MVTVREVRREDFTISPEDIDAWRKVESASRFSAPLGSAFSIQEFEQWKKVARAKKKAESRAGSSGSLAD